MTLVLLGAGVMGESILSGVLEAGLDPSAVTVVEHRGDRATEIADRYGVRLGDVTAVAGADTVLVAVKPYQVPVVLGQASQALASTTLMLSVAGGLTTAQLESWLPAAQPVVRAMPNTPALVRSGVSAITAGRHATDQHLGAAESLLAAVGTVVRVPEEQMDAVAAVSGSGPAYVFLVVEALIEGGVRAGLPRELATALATDTLAGSSALLTESGEHPAVLRERVTSPGGTTAAALYALESRGLRAAFSEAVLANRDRSRELAAGGGH